MENVSPIGRSVREEMTEQARLDPQLRAELERLRPFEEVARQIIRLRLDHGLSQEALAERVGTTKSAISRLESGQHAPNLATLDKIAAAFGGHVEVAFHVPDESTNRRVLTPA
jgi:DNA-binding XRE family transcriptional regulator